jgi:glycerol-3-phosphate acyltransferase PlsY
MEHFFAALTGYLIGSIPFGLVLTRAAGLGDVRNIGSGNIGATNVLRTGRKGLAAATLLLDLGKGLAAVLLVRYLWPDAVGLAALAVVVGHCFPVWLKFKGGKGVATNAGVAFGLAWPIGLAYALVWLGVLGLTRISSLAGMSGVLAAVIMAALGGWPEFVPVLLAIAALVIWLHRENLKRLREGTEPRLGGKK